MLNVGMTELLCFAIIALLVLGPEKLPEAARFVAKWYGKAKRFIQQVQSEVDRGLQLADFRQELQQEIDRMTQLERRLEQQLSHLTQTSKPIPSTDCRYQWCANAQIHPFSIQHIRRHGIAIPSAVIAQTQPELRMVI